MNLSQSGLDLIKSFEGCKLTAYKVTDAEKYWTIGYGHYGSDVQKGMKITQDAAEDLLKKDVQSFVDGVNQLLTIVVTQNQFDALVSFSYNCGLSALKKSDLLKFTNAKDWNAASNEFGKWVHSGSVVLQGLVNRRNKEKELYLKDLTVKKKATPKKKEDLVPYVIQTGDTLSELAKKFKCSVNYLLDINPTIQNRHLIFTGEQIKVPNVNQPKTQVYTIRSGENLTKVSKRFNTTVSELMKLNPQIKNKNLVFAGQKIKVPEM